MQVEVHLTMNGIEVVDPVSRKSSFTPVGDSCLDWKKQAGKDILKAREHVVVFTLPQLQPYRMVAYSAQDDKPFTAEGLVANALGFFIVEHGCETTQLSVI